MLTLINKNLNEDFIRIGCIVLDYVRATACYKDHAKLEYKLNNVVAVQMEYSRYDVLLIVKKVVYSRFLTDY